MKLFKLFITIFALAVLLVVSNKKSRSIDQTVNSVIGDLSYFKTLGYFPTVNTNENVRIKAHLKYVENKLRSKDISSLTEMQKENRLKMLDLLIEYNQAGIFPKNYDLNRRTPCFIDKNENICAVGYLIEQTAGRQVAEEINSKFKYEYILAMNDETVDNWIQSSGLTKEECAMIQPTYSPDYSTSYGVTSSVLSGLNLSLNCINGMNMLNGSKNKTGSIIGLVTGAGQITLGAINLPTENDSYWGANPAKRSLSLINIGLGTGTLKLSGWSLIKNNQPKDKNVSWNVYSFSTLDNNSGLGLSFTKRL